MTAGCPNRQPRGTLQARRQRPSPDTTLLGLYFQQPVRALSQCGGRLSPRWPPPRASCWPRGRCPWVVPPGGITTNHSQNRDRPHTDRLHDVTQTGPHHNPCVHQTLTPTPTPPQPPREPSFGAMDARAENVARELIADGEAVAVATAAVILEVLLARLHPIKAEHFLTELPDAMRGSRGQGHPPVRTAVIALAIKPWR